MKTFNQELWDSIPWVRVTDDLALPDIAALLRLQLDKDEGASFAIDSRVVGEQITRQLAERKNQQKVGAEAFRLSASGNCLRRLALDFHGVPHNGFRGDGGSRIVFAYGDAVEAMVTLALTEACMHIPAIELSDVLDEQRRVWLQVNMGDQPWMSFRIPGSPDGDILSMRWMHGETPEQAWENSREHPVRCVLEVKSASDFGFKKFREHGLTAKDRDGRPEGYYYQTQAYQLARRQEGQDVEWSYVLMFGKGSSAKDAEISPDFAPPVTSNGKPRKTFLVENELLWRKLYPVVGRWIKRDEDVQADIVNRFQRVTLSKDPNEFPRIMEPKGKERKLSFPCDWCPHLFNCWPNAREVASRTGWFHTQTKTTILAGD